MSKFLLPVFLAAGLSFSGCVHGREAFMNKSGPKRAAFELKCSAEQLNVVEIDASTVGVEGCGQSAVYKWVQTGRYNWDWVRN